MDEDLYDMLMAWYGAELEEPRREALLARLVKDAVFRRDVAAELEMLGQLKAVQASEPRWFLLEEKLGWSSHAPVVSGDREAVERETMRQIGQEGRSAVVSSGRFQVLRRFLNRLSVWRSVALLFVVVLTGALVAGAFWAGYRSARRDQGDSAQMVGLPAPSPVNPLESFAVLLRADQVLWNSRSELRPSVGDEMTMGQLVADQGRFILAFVNGAVVHVEAPAELTVVSASEVFCHRGRLRTQVPAGVQGFTVLAPDMAVDLGSDYALNVPAAGHMEVLVLQGQAQVSLLNESRVPTRSRLVVANDAVEVDPQVGEIRNVQVKGIAFADLIKLSVNPLAVSPSYRQAVLDSKPWGYWRFEAIKDEMLVNEFAGGPALRVFGSVEVVAEDSKNNSLVFASEHPEQYILMDALWEPRKERGYAVELWMMPVVFQLSNILSLVDDSRDELHSLHLGLTAAQPMEFGPPGVVRLLHRWPPSWIGGVNAYSPKAYLPYQWHHLVGQRNGDQLELYVNGELADSVPLKPDEIIPPSHVLIGRLKRFSESTDLLQARPYLGRLDEVALYDHALSPDEIRRHYELGKAALREAPGPQLAEPE